MWTQLEGGRFVLLQFVSTANHLTWFKNVLKLGTQCSIWATTREISWIHRKSYQSFPFLFWWMNIDRSQRCSIKLYGETPVQFLRNSHSLKGAKWLVHPAGAYHIPSSGKTEKLISLTWMIPICIILYDPNFPSSKMILRHYHGHARLPLRLESSPRQPRAGRSLGCWRAHRPRGRWYWYWMRVGCHDDRDTGKN